ncbi:hypothetical protein MMC10_009848 [Thelotrema lepadinum]|nr:hypothetical protein [Thelotrema lepadinum]
MRTIGDLIAVLQGIDANIEIKNALQNQDIFDRLKVSFLSSSGETQKAFRQAMKSVPDDNSRNARLLQSISKLDKVSLPAEVEEKFQGSRRNPNSFWSPVTSSLNPVALKTLSPTSSFLEICDFAKSLQGKAFWTHIIWRFLALFFFDISQLYRVNRLHSANANRTSELLEALQIDQRNFGSIGPDLKKWLGAGETYAKLAHALGEGSLFLLPHELTNQHFEQRMSLQSDHFENLLKELKAKGIADESSRIGAQELGRTVRDSIIAPFKVAVGTYAAKQDDVPPKTLKRSSSRKHMQTKKAKSAANKNFQPTSSTARIQDKVSLMEQQYVLPKATILEYSQDHTAYFTSHRDFVREFDHFTISGYSIHPSASTIQRRRP